MHAHAQGCFLLEEIMNRQSVVRWAGLCLVSLLAACGRSGNDAKPAVADTPATIEQGAPWAEEQVTAALAKHGETAEARWTTAYWGAAAASEQRLVVEDLKATFTPDNEVTPTKGKGEWAGRISFTAERHRFEGEAASAEAMPGPGPLGAVQVHVLRKPDGSVFWAGGSPQTLSATTLSLSPNQQDVLDSTLQEFQHPGTSVEQRTAGHHISVALRQDVAAARATGAGPNQPPEINAAYIERADAIDLAKCPPEFASAYKAHIQAWRDANKSVIESTWAEVEKVAHHFGAGTSY
jgi:hypothetical protein